jgi:hypothetical protein
VDFFSAEIWTGRGLLIYDVLTFISTHSSNQSFLNRGFIRLIIALPLR